MTWIIPETSEFYHYVQATGDLKVDYPEHWMQHLMSCLWRSSAMLKPSSVRMRLKKNKWLRKLCGMILKPSQQKNFEDALISYFQDIPVSPGPSPASDKADSTPDIFGRILKESYRQLDLFTSSSKTYRDYCQPEHLITGRTCTDTLPNYMRSPKHRGRGVDGISKNISADSTTTGSKQKACRLSPRSISAYKTLVSKLSLACLQRRKSARLTNGSDCLSWPTIKATDGEHGGPNRRDSKGQPALPMAVQIWPTPNARDHKGQDMPNRTGGSSLPHMLQGGQPAPASPSTNGKSRELLWRTPAAQEPGVNVERLEGELGARMYDKETGRLAQYSLTQQVNWQTPHGFSGQGSDGKYGGGGEFAKQVKNWQTPEARNQKGYHNQKDGTVIEKLGTQAGKGKLSADWVESLMNVPLGWTQLPKEWRS